MSDKELDNLFQSRFDNFEVHPSADLWSKIESELEDKKPVKKLVPFRWMAAASVVLIAGMAFYFSRPIKTIQLHGKADQLVKTEGKAQTESDGQTIAEESTTGAVQGKSAEQFARSAGQSTVKVRQTEKQSQPVQNIDEVKKPVNNEPVLAQTLIQQPKQEQKLPEVSKQNQVESVEKPVYAAADTETEPAAYSDDAQQKKRIRTVGDLVNFVVAKVDKREDKLIEFSNNDEGSKVSGINLGFVKLKSRK